VESWSNPLNQAPSKRLIEMKYSTEVDPTQTRKARAVKSELKSGTAQPQPCRSLTQAELEAHCPDFYNEPAQNPPVLLAA
jgi:hypothetical protein